MTAVLPASAAAALATPPPAGRRGGLRPRQWRGLLEAGLRLSGALLQVLSAVLVARIASETQAGYYFIGFAAITFMAVLCRAGFDQALTRTVAADLALGRASLARATIRDLLLRFLRRAAWACPLVLAGVLAVMFAPQAAPHAHLATALLPFLLAVPFFGVAALAGVALQAAGRPLLSVLSLFFIHNFVVLAAAFLPAPLIEAGAFNFAFLAGSVAAALVGAVALIRTLRARVAAAASAAPDPQDPAQDLAARRVEVRALVRDNAWTVVGNLVLVWGPLGLVGALASPVEAARFGIAGRLAQLVSFALPALNFVLAPRFAALSATRREPELRSALLGSLALSLALSSVVALPMIAFAAPIMQFFGPGYAASAGLLVLLAAAQWANGASGAAIQFLAMTGSEKPLRRIFVLSASLALAAGIPLVWMTGATGAAQLALGSSLLLNLLCTLVALRSIRRMSRRAVPPADAPPVKWAGAA